MAIESVLRKERGYFKTHHSKTILTFLEQRLFPSGNIISQRLLHSNEEPTFQNNKLRLNERVSTRIYPQQTRP